VQERRRSLKVYFGLALFAVFLGLFGTVISASYLFNNFYQSLPSSTITPGILDLVESSSTLSKELSLIAAAAFLLICIVASSLYRRLSKALNQMRQSADSLAKGEFSHNISKSRVVEIDELAIAMKKMAKQLRHLEQVRSDFVANVSHELRTPVTSIKGFTETLIEGASEDKRDLDKFLAIIARQSDRLGVIIDDLLTLSRLESERASELLVKQDVGILDLLSAVFESCRLQAEQKNIILKIEDGYDGNIIVDRSLMEQSVINLVDNAIKYSDKSAEVRIRAKEINSKIVIEIEDTGPGIPNEHLSRLFERFYRVDKARSRGQGGTGLGLAIVKHVAALHDGGVEVTSAVGKGSIFRILLPNNSN
jgi:signal transduction histidine kinase